jgi:hypothetical protein
MSDHEVIIRAHVVFQIFTLYWLRHNRYGMPFSFGYVKSDF